MSNIIPAILLGIGLLLICAHLPFLLVPPRKLAGKQYRADHAGLYEISDDAEGANYLWSDVYHVAILTTSDGPFLEDVFFIIRTDTGDIVISHSDAVAMQLLEYFKVFAEFDWGKVVEAMGSTSEASFACWDRSWGTPPANSSANAAPA